MSIKLEKGSELVGLKFCLFLYEFYCPMKGDSYRFNGFETYTQISRTIYVWNLQTFYEESENFLWHFHNMCCSALITDKTTTWANGVLPKKNRNSVNSANSSNLINLWSMTLGQFKDAISHLCLAGAAVVSRSLTQEVAGPNLSIDKYFQSLNSANSAKTFWGKLN